jgi:predicted DNA-binding transcriptional regulator AlpA
LLRAFFFNPDLVGLKAPSRCALVGQGLPCAVLALERWVFAHQFFGEPTMTTSTVSPDAPAGLIDVKAVAALLNCSERHVWRLAVRRAMPAACRLGVLVRWNRALILAWIAAGCPQQTES